MTTYRWKDGAHVPAIDPQKAGEEIERLTVRHNGFLSPKALVDAARAKRHVLHGAFEWDDAKAADTHREERARDIIRSLTVVVEQAPRTGPVRAMVNVRHPEGGSSYTPMARAMSDADMRQQLLGRALDELKSWKRRYAELQELAKIFRAIDAMLDKDAA